MIKFTQTKFSLKDDNGKFLTHGNCYQTTIACLLEIPPSEVPNVETLFDVEDNPNLWYNVMNQFLRSKGREVNTDNRFQVFHDAATGVDDSTRASHIRLLYNEYYMVSGKSARGVNHVCIYQNGLGLPPFTCRTVRGDIF